MNYFIPIVSAGFICACIYKRRHNVALTSLRLYTQVQLCIQNFRNNMENMLKNKNITEDKFIPKTVRIRGDYISLDHTFEDIDVEMDKLYNTLPYYYIGTINMRLEYEYMNNLYYFFYTDVPKECVVKLKKLIKKAEKNKIKPKSKILSASIKIGDDQEKDIAEILQKYEGPFSSFSDNSVRVKDIFENNNEKIILSIINQDADMLEFSNNDLIVF